ncbi:MAG: TPM domain-containing protein, partial [Polyangiaceae bacterium]
MRSLLLAAIAALAILFASAGAVASTFVVPPIQGHVTDTAGVLSPEDRAALEQRLTRTMDESGREIAVFVVGSLQGETIEDVAYQTFNTWRVGRDKLDNGVLLVIAPQERRIRIETGKGVGGQLTDLQASDIIEHRIAPKLREGSYRGAIGAGIDGIMEALDAVPGQSQHLDPPMTFLTIGAVLVFIVIVLIRLRFGSGIFFWGGGGRGGGLG